jgi:hypothetical protein
MLTLLMLAAAVPAAADASSSSAFYVKVDLIVVNRVRSHSTSYDAWGRPSTTSTEQWWVSFWELLWSPAIPGHVSVPLGWIDRGWWTYTQCRDFSPCSEGWLVESKDGINVVAPHLSIVDSPYDWEMRNRRIYCPIRKP